MNGYYVLFMVEINLQLDIHLCIFLNVTGR